MYGGIGEEIGAEEEAGRLVHQHRISDRDGEEFWDGVLAYLHLGRLPESQDEAERIKQRSKRFFLMKKVLWRRNGDQPQLLGILNKDVRVGIAKEQHDDTEHNGLNP